MPFFPHGGFLLMASASFQHRLFYLVGQAATWPRKSESRKSMCANVGPLRRARPRPISLWAGQHMMTRSFSSASGYSGKCRSMQSRRPLRALGALGLKPKPVCMRVFLMVPFLGPVGLKLRLCFLAGALLLGRPSTSQPLRANLQLSPPESQPLPARASWSKRASVCTSPR